MLAQQKAILNHHYNFVYVLSILDLWLLCWWIIFHNYHRTWQTLSAAQSSFYSICL